MNAAHRLALLAAGAVSGVLAAAVPAAAQRAPSATANNPPAATPGRDAPAGTAPVAGQIPVPGTLPTAAPGDTATEAPPARSGFDASVSAILGRPGGITADQVAQRAAGTSFEVAARRQDVEAAAVALDQALMGLVPRLTVTARYTRLSDLPAQSFGAIVVARECQGPSPPASCAPGQTLPAGTAYSNIPLAIALPSNQTVFQASLNVPLSDYLLRLAQSYAAARHSHRAAELNEHATRTLAAFQARVSYWNLVRARLAAVVAEQAVAQSRAHLTDVQHLFDAGAVSEADVVRVQSQLASAQLLALRAHNLDLVAADAVRTAVHAPAGTALEVGDDVRRELPRTRESGGLAALYDEAIAHRPELRALAETLGSLREQVAVTRAGAFPRVDAFADVISANPNPRIIPPTPLFTTTWDVGIGLTWSPNDTASALRATSGMRARLAQLEAQRGAVRDQLHMEVTQAYTALREAEAALETTAAGLLAAEESYRVRRVLFLNGRATSVELTDAETDLTRARLDALNARVDLRVARARLEHATGRDVLALRDAGAAASN